MKKQYHRHIDNGGITVEVSQTPDLYTSLSISTSYHGYPNVLGSLSKV
jgi:hypothetical protein